MKSNQNIRNGQIRSVNFNPKKKVMKKIIQIQEIIQKIIFKQMMICFLVILTNQKLFNQVKKKILMVFILFQKLITILTITQDFCLRLIFLDAQSLGLLNPNVYLKLKYKIKHHFVMMSIMSMFVSRQSIFFGLFGLLKQKIF